MLILIIVISLSLAMAYFATQNVAPVTLFIGNFTLLGIPLYAVVLGSMLIGVLLSGVLYLINNLTRLASLSEARQQNKALKRENRDLKTEIARLNHQHPNDIPQQVAHHDKPKPAIIKRLRHNI
jgi:cell division protein FtsB